MFIFQSLRVAAPVGCYIRHPPTKFKFNLEARSILAFLAARLARYRFRDMPV